MKNIIHSYDYLYISMIYMSTKKRYLPSGTDKPPGKATFNATLRCETVTKQVRHRLADALPAIKGKAVTASSRLSHSLRLLHNRQLAVLVCPPLSPQGEGIIAREPQCRRDRQYPESAYINIIPSGLCNSSRELHLPIVGHQQSKERCPARTSCLLRVSTIRIMLSTLRQ